LCIFTASDFVGNSIGSCVEEKVGVQSVQTAVSVDVCVYASVVVGEQLLGVV
jgi:hypothetical protein